MKRFLLITAMVVSTITVCAQEEKELDIKYRRSSLYTVMIDKPGLPYAEEIKKNFINIPLPDKFNNHNLEKRIYAEGEIPIPENLEKTKKKKKTNEEESDMTLYASLETDISGSPTEDILKQIARDLVAKWFNRSENGGFDMELIKQRGSYDASAIDIAKAKASKRGVDRQNFCFSKSV